MLALNQNVGIRKIRRFAAATAVLALACVALPSFAHAEADVTPPVLAALTLPVQVSTGPSGAAVTVSARITDDLSGVAASDAQTACPAGSPPWPTQVSLRSPSDAVYASVFDPRGGDAYESIVQLPRFAPPGMWTVSRLSLTDCAGNTSDLTGFDLAVAGFPSTFTVRGEGDLTPPRLRALAVDPPSVDNTSPAVITVTATITDDLSGVASNDRATTCGSGAGSVSTVVFRSPSGHQDAGRRPPARQRRHVRDDLPRPALRRGRDLDGAGDPRRLREQRRLPPWRRRFTSHTSRRRLKSQGAPTPPHRSLGGSRSRRRPSVQERRVRTSCSARRWTTISAAC